MNARNDGVFVTLSGTVTGVNDKSLDVELATLDDGTTEVDVSGVEHEIKSEHVHPSDRDEYESLSEGDEFENIRVTIESANVAGLL